MNKRKFLKNLFGTSAMFPILNLNANTHMASVSSRNITLNTDSDRQLLYKVKLFNNRELDQKFGSLCKEDMLIQKENVMDSHKYNLSDGIYKLCNGGRWLTMTTHYQLTHYPNTVSFEEFHTNVPEDDVVLLTLKDDYKTTIESSIKERMHSVSLSRIPTPYPELTNQEVYQLYPELIPKNTDIFIFGVFLSAYIDNAILNKTKEETNLLRIYTDFRFGMISDLKNV